MEDIEVLYRKFLAKRCSREEAEILLRYFQDQANSAEILKLIEAELQNPEAFTETPEDQRIIDRNRIKLRESILGNQRTIKPTLWIAAAAIATVLSLGAIFYLMREDTSIPNQLTSQYGDDVLPGGNHAILTLGDGSTIKLDSLSLGLIAEQSGMHITKDEDGTITYNTIADGMDATGAVAFNTISTPRGGQYKVVLPDGTQVWLNATSSLKYPTHFSGSARKVELEGEGYFDVKHIASQPFYVSNGKQSIEVLGTQFNVNAYGDESSFIATLVNGSIRVLNDNTVQSVTLVSGQQAVFQNNRIHVHTVEASDFSAWKEGLIIMGSASFADVVKQIERWYDVSFAMPESVTDEKAYVMLNRHEKLSGLLKALEKTYNVHFKIQGREVLVIE